MLTRWSNWGLGDNPFAALEALRGEMDRIFEDLDRGLAGPHRPAATMMGSAAWPRVDLFDTGANLVVRAEVPGMEHKDLDVTLHEGTLTVKGSRADAIPDGYTAHRRERGAIEFARSFGLPCKVDPEKAKATLDDGVLTLTMAKSKEVQPRQIPVGTRQ